MTTERIYKPAKTVKEAIEEMKRCSGTQFDPEIANIFITLIEQYENVEQILENIEPLELDRIVYRQKYITFI